MGVWCKICGITSLEDARVVQNAGADALAFNFYEHSPRAITTQSAADIAGEVEVVRIGLFVDPQVSQVEQVLKICELDMLQFSGDEPEAFCEQFGLPYLKSVHVSDDENPDVGAQVYPSAWALLLDTFVEGFAGGTGRTFDWERWPRQSDRKLILAGGLDPGNVGEAIARVSPFGVDVSSGVEGPVKGTKDHRKVEQFVRTVKERNERRQ